MKTEELQGWFAGRLPEGWFVAPPEIEADRDEIWVVGELADVGLGEAAEADVRRAARRARIERFRKETRPERIAIARQAERLFGRKVAWGAVCGGERAMFTTAGVPVMTRLRLPERRVLDTLIAAGVARSRSEALAWCVKLVGRNEADWIGKLRDALGGVEQARAQGPAGA